MLQVLVCAPSNIAVEHLAQRIHQTGVKVVRVASKSREQVEDDTSFLALHNQVTNYTGEPKFTKLCRLKQELGELSDRDQRQYSKLYRKIEDKFLQAADVICCTCASAGDRRIMAGRPYRSILIDEATQVGFVVCLCDALCVCLMFAHCYLCHNSPATSFSCLNATLLHDPGD